MNITIAAATGPELNEIKTICTEKHVITYAVHGVGLLPTAFHLQRIAAEKPDLIIQCGIAGSYNTGIHIGETVMVANEMTDTGAETGENTLLSTFDLELMQKNIFPFEEGLLPCPFAENKNWGVKKVSGLTVSYASGTEETIEKRKNKYHADIETMEGAALHYICLMMNIPFLQIRTISNKVEKRNKLNWDIPLALKNNTSEIKRILELI